MQVRGTEKLTAEEVEVELALGGRFVFYEYCVSIVIATMRRPSDVYFLPANDLGIVRGLPYVLLSFFFGWWGIPWGPIYTIQSLWVNFSGGRDVTKEVMEQASAPAGAMPMPQT